MRKIILLLLILSLFAMPAYATQTASRYSRESCLREQIKYYGKITNPDLLMANGRRLNDNAFTCASWDYSFGTLLKVTNLANGKSVVVEVCDRGPAKKLVKQGRVIDLSKAAFEKIADLKEGIIEVKIEVIK